MRPYYLLLATHYSLPTTHHLPLTTCCLLPQAYRKAALRWHPDKARERGGGAEAEAEAEKRF